MYHHNNLAVSRRLMKEVGKMSLFDLAGSECDKDTTSSDRLQQCIRVLGRGDSCHVPFRGSTLTKVLRDLFNGDKSKVCMITMVSPTYSNV
ncbi:unnamed protein product [Adineta steineri]|uniref:Kinesin motor domain-containing protein n=1 Tax=Adineta steineri TaxID=433720 RepID=A0A815YMD8_9BILA|nr:unnamed protein product [Adineta steineri]CAF1572630.1 unnamed protein product [Adineta steineri]